MGGGHIFKSAVDKMRLRIKYLTMTVDKASKLEKILFGYSVQVRNIFSDVGTIYLGGKLSVCGPNSYL